MKTISPNPCRSLSLILLLTGCITAAHAQVVRIGPKVAPRPLAGVTLGGTATVSASPGSTTFRPLVQGGISAATSPIVLTTKISGLSLVTTVSLYGYFSSTAALSDSRGDSIPTSAILGQCATGSPTAFTAFTSTDTKGLGAGSALLIWQTSNLLGLGSGRTDSLSLEINLSKVPQTPAGTYTGTVNFLVEFL